jgi:glycerol-3-phosphate acyltransferase PlsX
VSRIVLDAMGGDHAPAAVLQGAALAVERGFVRADELVLVGPEAQVRDELRRLGLDGQGFPIVDAPDVLTGTETPVDAMRKKPRNSITVGMHVVKDGRAEACVSAGSTGAVVAAATMLLGLLEGIRRPGIAVTIEGEGGPFVIIDVGANPQPKPIDLLHYALMGSAYFRDTFHQANPRVGVVNIGSEEGKGNPLTKEAIPLLRDAPVQFVGNVEGVDVFRGVCDVVACDGFTGNVLLKVSEGVAEYMLRAFARTLAAADLPRDRVAQVVDTIRAKVDYSEYGGALLLGVRGIVTICHGRSQAPAIANAIRFAHRAVGARVNEHIAALAKAASPSV